MRSILVPRNNLLRATLPQTAPARVTFPNPRRRSFTHTIATPSTAGYGDIDQTGESSRTRAVGEHPGYEPVVQGKGGEKNSMASNKGRGEAVKSEGRREAWSSRKTKFDMSMPEPNERDKEEVEKHNREMDKRYDRKQGVDETVGRGFWSGELGSGVH